MRATIGAAVAAALLATTAAAFGQPGATGLVRTELQRHGLTIEGHEAVQTRVEFAPGAVVAWHRHPGEELVYVRDGVLEFTIRGRPPVVLRAGDVYFVPAGAVHMARNTGAVRGIELATYIVETGKPLLEYAEGPAPH